jgi:Adenylate kinase and related kinases
MNIVIIGPPACGKGTLAKSLMKRYDLAHIEAGNLLRERAAMDDKLGREIGEIISRGDFVSEDLIFDLITDKLTSEDCETGFIVDGFPRTITQAQRFDMFLKSKNIELDHVFSLIAPEDALVERMQKRASGTQNKRSDDKLTVFFNRIANYKRFTSPLTGYYKAQDLTREIDASGTMEETLHQARQVILSKAAARRLHFNNKIM